MDKKQRGYSSRNQEQEFSSGTFIIFICESMIYGTAFISYNIIIINLAIQTELRNKIFQLNELT